MILRGTLTLLLFAIAMDPTGSAFVTGLTLSSNFSTASPLQASCTSCAIGREDAFVTELNATGAALVYSTFLGGNDLRRPTMRSVDMGPLMESPFPSAEESP